MTDNNSLTPVVEAVKTAREVAWEKYKAAVDELDFLTGKRSLSAYRTLGAVYDELYNMRAGVITLAPLFDRDPADPAHLNMVQDYIKSLCHAVDVLREALAEANPRPPTTSKFVSEEGELVFIDNSDKVA